MTWQRKAACNPVNNVVTFEDVDSGFFNPRGPAPATAKAVCRRLCPVFLECRAWIDRHETAIGRAEPGLYAGEDPSQRAARRQAKAAMT